MVRRTSQQTLIGLFISLFLISSSFAEEPQKVRINLFDGGQNSSDLSDIINPNQGTLVSNAVISKRGQLPKRRGQSLFASDLSNTAFRGIGVFNPDPNTSYIICASDTKVIRSTADGKDWSIINSNNLLTANKDTEFIQANNLYFVLNGYNNTANYNVTIWDPGSASAPSVTVASPPVATTGAWLRNYLFLAGDPNQPDWVYFSNNLFPRKFSPLDLFKVNTGDGQKIVRIESFKLNELIIYKEKSIFTLDITGTTPLADWTLQAVTTAIGCAARRSVVNMGNDHWFLSSEPFAVRSLVRTSFDKLFIDMVSQPIQDIFDGTGDKTLNKTQASKACAILFDNKYILAIPTGTATENNYTVVYDFITKSWYTIDGWYPAAWAVWKNNLYYIDNLDGRVVRCFATKYSDIASGPIVTTSSQPTVAVKWEYRSKSIDFDNPENFKKLDALEVQFEASGNYTVDVYINLDKAGWQNVGTINLSDDAPTLPNTLPISLTSTNIARKTFQLQKYGEFKKMQVRFVQNGVNQYVNLHSYTIFAEIKKWRRE